MRKRLYDAKGAHDEYLDYLSRKTEKKNVKFIGIADIADFSPRIYQHRLENVIEVISSNTRGVDVARVLVKKLISNLMGRNSYGIPVGPFASRVLAEAVLVKLQEFDLMGMLKESVSDQNLVDYEIVKYVLTKLHRVPRVSEDLKKQVLNFVIENAELLYPVAEQIAKYVHNYQGLTAQEKKKIANQLLKPLRSKRNPPPDYYEMWILWIFSTSEDWNHSKDIIKLYQQSSSEVLKRYASLAIAMCRSRSEALVIKKDFSASSDLLKLAILTASKKLGKDERKHWKLANQVNGILEKKSKQIPKTVS